jgi:ornithine carbamoyltransferase
MDCLSPERAAALMERARALQSAAQAGRPARLLRGRRFGLLASSATSLPALRFRRAAIELGAQVTDLAPVGASFDPTELESTARVLGQLYDAIACEGLEPALSRRLADAARVPVYRDIASERHPSAALASALGSATGDDAERRFMLQALLLESTL